MDLCSDVQQQHKKDFKVRHLYHLYDFISIFQNFVEEKLVPTWNWMVSIMDSTEAQLRYGSALSSAGDPGHPSHPLHASQNSGRRERMTAREEASLRTLEGRRLDSEHFK